MGKFKFMEVAVEAPSNRGYFLTSKEAITKPFSIENRFSEFWRSMFVYSSDKPDEEDAMFGNFYIECDHHDFRYNRIIMLEVADYLKKTFNIPYSYMDFFMTNRSIWLMVPAKVFGCFGSKHLHRIYKAMAEEIQQFLYTKSDTFDEYSFSWKKDARIDLSIYKWNGLIHSLGSFLPQKKRWVTKFSFGDLEEANKESDVLEAKYDNHDFFNDVNTIEAAKSWFHSKRKEILRFGSGETPFTELFKCERTCMSNLEKQGVIEENRNLHIYSYSLYLKELGYDTNQAVERVQSVFDMKYVHTKEVINTVKSAIEGNKKFNCTVVKQLLDEDLFDCETCPVSNASKAETFLVPRKLIEKLQSEKAHYDSYKWLLRTLHNYQVDHTPTKVNLKGEKYKKLVEQRIEVLEKIGVITIEKRNNDLILHPIHLDKELYQSHIVVPVRFIRDTRFVKMKAEIKILLELWRSSLLSGHKQKILSFNVKTQNLLSKLGMSIKVFNKHMMALKKMKFVFGKQLFVFLHKAEVKEKVKTIIRKLKQSMPNGGYKVSVGNESEFELDSEIKSPKQQPQMQDLQEIRISGFLSIF